MPVGGFESFDACMLAMKEQGHDEESARRICGQMEKEAKLGELDGRWIEIFRAGDYGEKGNWTEAELDRMAAAYNPQLHRAPVVIGHPQHDAPAWGWVDKLKRAGNSLWAQLAQVAPEFEQLVKDGRFSQRSVALYNHLKEADGPYLRHLGFLGAQPPEVKGLKAIQLSDGGGFVAIDLKEEEHPMDAKELAQTVEAQIRSFFSKLFGEKKSEPGFTEADLNARLELATKPLLEKLEQLTRQFSEEKQQAAARAASAREQTATAEIKLFAERLKAKKAAPAFAARAVAFAEALLSGAAEVTFAEKDKDGKAVKEEKLALFPGFCQLAEAYAPVVPTGELAGGAHGASKLIRFNEPGRGQELNPESIALAERAEALEPEIRKENPKFSQSEVAGAALQRARREAAAGSISSGQA